MAAPHRLIRSFGIYLVLSMLVTTKGSANPLRAPDISENKLYLACTKQLTQTFRTLLDNREDMSTHLYKKLSGLLMSAEIDSQFKHYPSCVNKLERARFFLKVAGFPTSKK